MVLLLSALRLFNCVDGYINGNQTVDPQANLDFLKRNITYQILAYYVGQIRNALTMFILWYFSIYKTMKGMND